jgi:hypothetical protein
MELNIDDNIKRWAEHVKMCDCYMPGPLQRRRGRLVYHRGKGRYATYSAARDRKRKSAHRLLRWPVAKRKKIQTRY